MPMSMIISIMRVRLFSTMSLMRLRKLIRSHRTKSPGSNGANKMANSMTNTIPVLLLVMMD